MFELLKINFIELTSYLLQLTEHQRLNNITHFDDLANPSLTVNQKLANLLSSFRTFDDHISHEISKFYGANTKEIQLVKEIKSKIYDQHFAYRFFSKLRNYVQHYGLPIAKINFYEGVEEINNKTFIKFSVQAIFSKSKLMEYNDWGSVRDDFDKIMKDEFSLNKLLDEFYYSMLILYKDSLRQLFSLYDQNREFLLNIYNDCLKHSGEPADKHHSFALPVFFINKESNKEIHLPVNNLRRIDRLITKHKINEINFLMSYSSIKMTD